ncbi:MAG: TIGR03546 family protein [Planctomycetota bacterium]
MLLMILKLLSSLKKAIAGRRYPAQLAWAIGFGVMLGIVPHGNLLALVLLVLVLSLKINHAAVALCGVAASFAASEIDPYAHQVGLLLHQNAGFNEYAVEAWSLPLMPWTDLNNTIVLGSFTIAIASVVPIFLVTYPLLRLIVPRQVKDESQAMKPEVEPLEGEVKELRIEVSRKPIPSPHIEIRKTDTVETAKLKEAAESAAAPPVVPFEELSPTSEESTITERSDAEQSMDEALHYLLRQLRDSQRQNGPVDHDNTKTRSVA